MFFIVASSKTRGAAGVQKYNILRKLSRLKDNKSENRNL